MECPNCKEKYQFYEVPFEYRNMKFLVTEFLCPFCEVWITPSKLYIKIMSVVFALAITSIIFVFLSILNNADYKIYAIGSGLMSFISFIFSYQVLKYEVKE